MKSKDLLSVCKILVIPILLLSCNTPTSEKKFVIGFSQCTGDNNWKRATLNGINKEMSFHPGSRLIYKNANDNSELQKKQITELLEKKIDILLVSPNEAEPLTSLIEDVFNKGIPVVVIDRKTSSGLYTSFVGVNNFEIGKIAGNYIANSFQDTINVIEVIGLPGSTPANERQRGFAEGVRSNPRIRIKSQVYGNWLKEKSSEELFKIKDTLSAADVVFAHNDPMALGAYEVYKKLGLEKAVRIIGVDGLSGPGGGIQFVSDKIIKATLLNPTGSEEALQVAFKILNNEPFNKENTLPTVLIDSTNVRIMKLQTDKIQSQQHDIERQRELLMDQQRIYKNQRNLLYMSIGGFILVFLLGSVTFFALRNNRKINRALALQNKEIYDQRNQLVEMTSKAKEATEMKFNFFTNISHELRTTLTLILGPLEDSFSNPRLHFTVKKNLDLIYRNTIRLLRLINQLMDFRKIEESKMKLKASENNLSEFVIEVTEAFREIARKKSISFNVISKVKDLNVWFDINMLDKVLFNLFSNAFKFTSEHGLINVTIDNSANGKMAVIRVEDSGIGMTPDEVEHAFELFYQGHNSTARGTGLGLSLSKELIKKHHGTITVKSEKWKGTIFEISLPIGKSHLNQDEILSNKPAQSNLYEDIKIYEGDIEPALLNETLIVSNKEFSILIIEDNGDLRAFLRNRLSNNYEVHEAENGINGLSLVYDIVPDLIISDIILPGQTGLQITETLKQDIRTSHIPIILLTAKGSIEEQIEGIKSKADAFIVKPFNLEFFEETIKNLLKNRAVLREHYTSELPTETRSTPSKIDRKFINEFTAIVENNLSNEDFSVEDICKEISISKVQLYRKLKALLGYNVNDYILTVRMQKAKFLLINEDLSISEVALKVGFSSSAYFSTVFKSKFGCTPSVFKSKKSIQTSQTKNFN